jgi:hypothetical protein
MKNDAKKGGDRFDKFFEVEAFNPENSEHNKIVQKRINMMMHSPLMISWINESIWFGKDEELTFEVTKFVINCAIAFTDEKEFIEKIDFNSKEWIQSLDIRVSKVKKNN